MHTHAADLTDADAHLLPFIAHARAGFGGALIGAGLAVLLRSIDDRHGPSNDEVAFVALFLATGLAAVALLSRRAGVAAS